MPVWGQSRGERIQKLQPIREEKSTKTYSDAETNTLPVSNIGIVNLEQKKKPHNITIRNNRKEPKIKPNVKYSDKQRYRTYKTKIEPNLLNKIELNEENDVVNKIREAFGIKEEKQNPNYQEIETGSIAPIPQIQAQSIYNDGVDELPDISDINRSDAEELTFQAARNTILANLQRRYLQNGLKDAFNAGFNKIGVEVNENNLFSTYGKYLNETNQANKIQKAYKNYKTNQQSKASKINKAIENELDKAIYEEPIIHDVSFANLYNDALANSNKINQAKLLQSVLRRKIASTPKTYDVGTETEVRRRGRPRKREEVVRYANPYTPILEEHKYRSAYSHSPSHSSVSSRSSFRSPDLFSNTTSPQQLNYDFIDSSDTDTSSYNLRRRPQSTPAKLRKKGKK